MSIGNDCLYEYSVDQLFEILSEGRLPSASEAMLDILDVCRACSQRECPGIARMMAENASTQLAYTSIGRVESYPPDQTLHLVVAPHYEGRPLRDGSPDALVAEVAG